MKTAEPLWAVRKGQSMIQAKLRNRRALGWEVVLIVDERPWFGQRHPTRAAAIIAADMYSVALKEKGWSAV